MSPELEVRLRARYPLIFADLMIVDEDLENPPVPPLPSAFTAWGFQCGDGWYDLLDALCAVLQNATSNGGPQVIATQVKEKFGALRFHTNGHNAAQEGMIALAEMLSVRLCEVCGNRGRTIRDEWMRTRCPEHEES